MTRQLDGPARNCIGPAPAGDTLDDTSHGGLSQVLVGVTRNLNGPRAQ